MSVEEEDTQNRWTLNPIEDTQSHPPSYLSPLMITSVLTIFI